MIKLYKKASLITLIFFLSYNSFTKTMFYNDWDSTREKLIKAGVGIGSTALTAYLTAYAMKAVMQSNSTTYNIIPTKNFQSIAGTIPSQVEKIVSFIKEPTAYTALGATTPKGILFLGPPGNGKTLLAEAMAGEVGAKFLYASAGSFEKLYVGTGAKAVNELFAQARETQNIFGQFLSFLTKKNYQPKPAIIFIDEIDAIGLKKSEETHSERRKTLDTLLTNMDGIESST